MTSSFCARLAVTVAAGLGLAIALAGCAGTGDDSSPFAILLDGYPVASAGTANGQVSLPGILEGDYLLSAVQQPDPRLGLHTLVHFIPGDSVDLRTINPFQGALLRGQVRRDSSSGPLLGNTRVVAVKGAAALLAAGEGPLEVPPLVGSDLTCVMGYTDASGQFVLGPMEYGDYLVTSVLPGYEADVRWVRLSASGDANANLVLAADASATTGAVRGLVTNRSGTTLSEPLITARLETPLEPSITASARSRVTSDSGLSMPAGPWFAWRSLTGTGSTAGQYLIDLPAGAATLEAFKVGWRALAAGVTVSAGGLATQDFALQAR